MSDNSGYTNIEDKFLDKRDLFGIRFGEGLVFLEVDWVENNKFDPYGEIEYEGEEGATVPSGRGTNFQRLEHNGDDILNIDDKTELKVIHAGIGMFPESFRRYTNYPEAGHRLRQVHNLTAPRGSRGSDYGYADGKDSPYDQPTDFEELVIPPGVNLDFAFYNGGMKERQPLLNIKMATYGVNPIDPDNNKDVIKRIVTPGSPMPIFSAGSAGEYIDFKPKWDVEPIGRDEARDL